MWSMAYKELKKNKNELVVVYETILMRQEPEGCCAHKKPYCAY